MNGDTDETLMKGMGYACELLHTGVARKGLEWRCDALTVPLSPERPVGGGIPRPALKFGFQNSPRLTAQSGKVFEAAGSGTASSSSQTDSPDRFELRFAPGAVDVAVWQWLLPVGTMMRSSENAYPPYWLSRMSGEDRG